MQRFVQGCAAKVFHRNRIVNSRGQRFIWGRATEMVSKSGSWYNDDPLFSAKIGINMGHIFKIFNLCENRPNFINLMMHRFQKFASKLNNFGK